MLKMKGNVFRLPTSAGGAILPLSPYTVGRPNMEDIQRSSIPNNNPNRVGQTLSSASSAYNAPAKSPRGLPPAQGLYDPRNERDACGIGFIVNIKGEPSHDIITKGIKILINLTHRGACGCDADTGDGAGILIQIPDKFFRRETAKLGFTLPPQGEYAVGMVFLPVDSTQRLLCEGVLERIAAEEGLSVLGWRDTPVDGNAIGRVARGSQPYIEQIFIRCAPGMDQEQFERTLYVVMKRAEKEILEEDEIRDSDYFYIPSL